MKYWISCVVLFSLILFFFNHADAEIYVNREHGFRLVINDDWEKVPNVTPIKLTLLCKAPDCSKDSRVFINSNFEIGFKSESQSTYFRRIPPSNLPGAVDQMMRGFGRIQQTISIRKGKLGNTLAYHAIFKIVYVNRQVRKMYYVMTFSKGVFYHLQFFANVNAFEKDMQKAVTLFSTFELLKSD